MYNKNHLSQIFTQEAFSVKKSFASWNTTLHLLILFLFSNAFPNERSPECHMPFPRSSLSIFWHLHIKWYWPDAATAEDKKMVTFGLLLQKKRWGCWHARLWLREGTNSDQGAAWSCWGEDRFSKWNSAPTQQNGPEHAETWRGALIRVHFCFCSLHT